MASALSRRQRQPRGFPSTLVIQTMHRLAFRSAERSEGEEI